jgi:hypothetical protein
MINLDDYRSGFVDDHSHMIKDSKITDFENYYSQNGEDGVLEKIFEVLNISKGTFVNAGCDDINDHSNVRRLVSHYGWDGLFIEPNGDMLSQGRDNLENDDRITDGEFEFHHGFLSVNKDDERITNVIADYYIGETLFDLVTLHIDSYEYWVLEDFLSGHYNAKVILVGYNFSRTDSVTAPKNIEPKIGHKSITDNFYSASAPALKKLANQYGYQLVSICKPNNLIFVHESSNNNLFKEYNILKEEDYYWEMDAWTKGRRNLINEGWVKV